MCREDYLKLVKLPLYLLHLNLDAGVCHQLSQLLWILLVAIVTGRRLEGASWRWPVNKGHKTAFGLIPHAHKTMSIF